METKPLLTLFKEQLENECRSLVEDRELNRGGALIHWYFGRILGFNESEIEEVFCDASNDLGIDAIWVNDDNEDEIVHFYQFKNPERANKGFPDGDVDKVISGLNLILSREHNRVSNPELQKRIQDIYQRTPKGYRLHFVSTGQGLELASQIKLKAFVTGLKAPPDFFRWEEEPLEKLHDQFYQRTLPAVADPIRFQLADMPYMVKSAGAGSFFFHIVGNVLADLYGKYKERLLQRNIRIWQKDTATNRSIQETCGGSDSANFLHYNNGITFICESAIWDHFLKTLTLEKGQVVNGGQTIRALDRASISNSLNANVLVPVRVIESKGNKEFASNVAINQNNQNQMGTGFLRSNDPGVVQLGHALESKGWYLERREGELDAMELTERAAILNRINRGGEDTLDRWTIKLKEGTQAYVATFFEQPELAKKNVKKIFLSTADGGSFETIFSTDLTAEKMLTSHLLSQHVNTFVSRFQTIKNRKRKNPSGLWQDEYTELIGDTLTNGFGDEVDQVIPQSAVFLCGTIFQDLTKLQNKLYSAIPDYLATSGDDLIRAHLSFILEYAKRFPDQKTKSWPTQLKSNTFFKSVVAYIGGIRRPGNGHEKPT